MKKIKTYDLYIYLKKGSKEYINISKSAIKYYIEYYKESEDFAGYDLIEHEN